MSYEVFAYVEDDPFAFVAYDCTESLGFVTEQWGSAASVISMPRAAVSELRDALTRWLRGSGDLPSDWTLAQAAQFEAEVAALRSGAAREIGKSSEFLQGASRGDEPYRGHAEESSCRMMKPKFIPKTGVKAGQTWCGACGKYVSVDTHRKNCVSRKTKRRA